MRGGDGAMPITTTPIMRAIIPCGGRGTRMLALTRGTAKELLPVAGVPVLRRVLRECATSGITHALIVVSPEKREIEHYALSLIGEPDVPAQIEFAVQVQPLGLADAVRHGRGFAGGVPVAVALPDNLFNGEQPAVAQVADTFARTGRNVVAVVEVAAAEAATRGPTPVYPGRVAGAEFQIERIPSKGAKERSFNTGGASSAYTGVGRYVFLPDAFDVIDAVERTLQAGAELDDIPVMQRLLESGELIGRRIEGRFLDVGIPEGYAEANALLAGRPSSGITA